MWLRLSSLPELQHLTEKQRAELFQKIGVKKIMVRIIIGSVLIGGIMGVVTTSIVNGLLITPTPESIYESWQILLTSVCGFSLVVYIVLIVMIRGQLVSFLSDVRKKQRLPMCHKCGYNLEGAQGNSCPECGALIGPPDQA